MYQVLYRKWRPQTFSDVMGQPHITATLKNELICGRLAHAYLFTGSRGTGKTTCAKILAKAVNCLSLKDGDPCGECEICRGLENGSVLDVVEIDAASNNGVENIRSLREEANFTPAAAKYRVYIIDEVHMLSIGAFNALLKTLEEPPAHVIFILATTEVHKLPATILSRCQRFDFHRIAPTVIAERLEYVIAQENASIEPEAALLLARLADGALRDALSLLDQCLGQSRSITVETVTGAAGLAGREHLFRLSDAISQKDSATALLVIDELYTASKDMTRLCEELSHYFRNLMLIKTMKDARDILAVPEEEYNAMSTRALAAPLPLILHSLDTLQNALERMYRGGNRRIEMEMAILRLCSPELDSGTDALVRRITALERKSLTLSEPTAPAIPKAAAPEPPSVPAKPTSSIVEEAVPPWEEQPQPPVPDYPPESIPQAPFVEPKAEKAVAPAASSESAPADTEALLGSAQRLAAWPEILQALKEYSRVVAASFTGSTAYVSGDFVLIDAPSPTAFELLRRPTQRDKMRDAIKQVTGRTYKLGPYKKASSDNENQQEQSDPLKALAEQAQAAGIEVTKT